MKRILNLSLCIGWAMTSLAQVAEQIDRGVVALNVDEQTVYVGWRMLVR